MTKTIHAARRSPRKTAGMVVIAAMALLAAAAVAGYVPSSVTAAAPQSGQTLTASPGTWTGDQPITFTYQWQRCNTTGAACAAIAGATQQTYVVQAVDVGSTLRVAVTGRNAVGSSTATSDQTSIVTRGTGSVPIENVTAPNRLLVDTVRFNPRRLSYSRTRTFSVTVLVRETSGRRPVSGALVFLRSTPIVTTTPAERATNSNGQITFTIRTESDFRKLFRPGYNLQFFVRARKSGEDQLAGVSSRRLVQVPIGG
jgi:hypothetical protein